MRKKIVATSVAVLVVALIGGGIWWLFNSGRLVYVANPSTGSASSSVVCGEDIVDRYNAAMYYQVRKEGDRPTVDDAGIKKLEEDIRSKDDFKSDATCQTLLFWIAVHYEDYNKAREAAVVVKDLHDKDIFADSNIRSNQPIFTYESHLGTLLELESGDN